MWDGLRACVPIVGVGDPVLAPLEKIEVDAALATLDRAIAESPADAIPRLVTALAARTTAASSRLLSEPTHDRDSTPDRNLSIREAAGQLGVSVSWLYRNHKALPFSLRLGQRVLFSAKGLERWNQQRARKYDKQTYGSIHRIKIS